MEKLNGWVYIAVLSVWVDGIISKSMVLTDRLRDVMHFKTDVRGRLCVFVWERESQINSFST